MNDRSRARFDLDELLHPAQAFEHPSQVVNQDIVNRSPQSDLRGF